MFEQSTVLSSASRSLSPAGFALALLGHSTVVLVLATSAILAPAILPIEPREVLAFIGRASVPPPPQPVFARENGSAESPVQEHAETIPGWLDPEATYQPAVISDDIPPPATDEIPRWRTPRQSGTRFGGIPPVAGLPNEYGIPNQGVPLFADDLPRLAPVSKPVPPERREPIRVSTGVISSKAIRRVAPVYPSLARAAGIKGTVSLQIRIGVTGDVEHVSVISGHPLLIEAAKTAIMRWKFTPTLLNGEPRVVIGTVSLRFILR